MSTVQVLVEHDGYAGALSYLLAREGTYDVSRVTEPDYAREGVIVADRQALERYPSLLQHSERLVIITPKDPALLSALYESNVRSVVFESDPPSTAVLAILGADLGSARTTAALPRRRRILVMEGRAASPNAAQIGPKRPV